MTDTPTAPTSPDRLEPTEAANRLYDELAESPLPGARYAYSVVRRRLPAIEAEARWALEAEVERLRRQNKEHAERRDREMAALQSQVDRHAAAVHQARELVRGTPVDWTDDPPSREPDGWWNYTSARTREVLIAAVLDARAALSPAAPERPTTA